MAEYQEDLENLVPFEIGIQSGETILMWVGGLVFYILSFLFMAFAIGWDFGGFYGPAMYGFGGILLLASQFVTRWNPITTTRIPITGIALWMFVVVFGAPILYRGWEVYSDSSMLWFFIGYLILAVLITGGLLASNFLTSLKIMNWMSMDMATTLYAGGIIAMLIGITIVGFNNNALLDLSELNLLDWFFLFGFAMSFFFMLELYNGAHRFNDIVKYAKKRASGEFSLTPVINSYYIMGFILMDIIGAGVFLVLLINFFVRWSVPYISEQLANSVMMNSVYSIVFIIAIVFIPNWIVLILWMEAKGRKEAEEEEAMRRKIEKDTRVSLS
jgi:hypothetical protein